MLLIWAITATAAAAVLALLWFLYRRQVKHTCRQLAFLKVNKTNLRLTSDFSFGELDELIDAVNEVIDRSRELQQHTLEKESHLKETITSLSHDIRTPLTSLDGYFQLLLQSGSPEERRKYIGIIQTRIDSLNGMLEELFTYAKLQDTDYRLEIRTVDFAKCVYDTVFSFYEDFQSRGIEPSVNFCEGRLWVAGNGEALCRALQNLIKNALEHGHTQISLELFVRDSSAVFRCSNDTKSPDEIDIQQVFGRFYKADSARTRNSTGLGLSIAKGLVERMGGAISAQMEGSRFAVQTVFPLLPDNQLVKEDSSI